MFKVWKETVISSAHNLRGYKGACENLHGHNWRVRVTVSGERLDGAGLLVDFEDLDRAMKEVCGRYDHIYFNETPPFTDLNPSAENIARVFFDELSGKLNTERYRVSEVMVWESDGCCASFSRE
jgi:6-pyruvoyltetrahydropterin/6-carboxytetrahydropterin synthase